MLNDLIDTLFDDEIFPARWSRSLFPVLGGYWVFSDNIHELCNILRASRKNLRVDIVKYPPAVL